METYDYYGMIACAGNIIKSMRKLRESERNHQVRLAPRIEVKISGIDNAVDLCKGDCEAVAEVERLRELAVEQQEAIEVLRQAVKEKERKLDQLSNKKKKEEFYKQWLELEPVAEVDDEEEHEEGDSALSSAPSSLSPQPGGCGQWQANGVTREAYEAVLLEVEELQTRLFEEQQELAHAKSQVRDLEKALLQETRGSQNSRRALSDKLRESEEREATLLAEISELREQNELLEFRVLELEETPCPRDTLDPAESTIVSPEPIHLYKDQLNKQRDRAVATVIPYNTYTHPASPVPQKPPLSLQESGIFEEEEEDENDAQVELASRGTQTEAPAGELLQEVQRLHELRARIQERAVRVPVPMADAKSCSPTEVTDTVDMAQLTSYQERIRELEVRLGTYEEEVDKRTRERQVSKQREEDLLDENYRLTERVCWFESELRNYEAAGKIEKSDAMTETDSFPGEVKVDSEDLEQRSQDRPNLSSPPRRRKALRDTIDELNSGLTAEEKGPLEMNGDRKTLDQIQLRCAREECVECRNLWTDYDRKIQCLSRAEYCLKEQIADLERRERAFTNTLQQADSTWSQMESDYVGQLEELKTRLNEKVRANRQLLEQLTGLEEDIHRYQKLSICDLCKKPARDADEVDHVGSVLAEAANSEPKVTPMEVDPPDDLRSSKAKNSGDCVRSWRSSSEIQEGADSKKSEITRATQTDESAVTTDCHSSAKSVPELTQPPAVKTNPPPVSHEESVSRCGAAPSVHSLITVNVPLENNAGAVAELATEAKEEAFEGEEPRKADEPLAQVRVVPEEQPLEEVDAVVTFTESEPEKKVRPRCGESREREGWVMRAWNTRARAGAIRQNFSCGRTHRLVLYQEICV